jgi:hypothetical protein
VAKRMREKARAIWETYLCQFSDHSRKAGLPNCAIGRLPSKHRAWSEEIGTVTGLSAGE